MAQWNWFIQKFWKSEIEIKSKKKGPTKRFFLFTIISLKKNEPYRSSKSLQVDIFRHNSIIQSSLILRLIESISKWESRETRKTYLYDMESKASLKGSKKISKENWEWWWNLNPETQKHFIMGTLELLTRANGPLQSFTLLLEEISNFLGMKFWKRLEMNLMIMNQQMR